MNYRHAFHAGNFADVAKHALLVALVTRLRAKPKPVCVIDAFAGVGRYALTQGPAQRTGEYRDGIARLFAADPPPAGVERYLDLVRAENQAGSLARYPGSPALVAALLRDGDRLVAVENHPEDAAALKHAFAADPRVQVHRRDGYEAIAALVPPPERRGLVLVDPAYEVVDEFARMTAAVTRAHRRWPTGVYALWYPIKHRPPVDAFLGDLALTGLRRILVTELTVRPATAPDRLNGAGLLVVNPPYGFEAEARELLDGLVPVLARAPGAGARVETLVGE